MRPKSLMGKVSHQLEAGGTSKTMPSFTLNLSILERPIPRPLPRQLACYLILWIPHYQQYRFIIVEHDGI